MKSYKNFLNERVTNKEIFPEIYAGRLAAVKEFIEGGGDPNFKRDDETLLMYAADIGRTDIVEYLLTLDNLDVNYRNPFNGWSALRYAADNSEIAELILKHPKLEINSVDGLGWTDLIQTAKFGNYNSLREILRHPDIDINIQDQMGMTALMRAVNSMNDDYVDEMPAEEHEHLLVALILMKEPKIDLTLKDEEGETFLDYLKKKQCGEFKDYDLQKTIIKNNPRNLVPFIKKGIVNAKIKKEYPHLITGSDLNLLD